MTINQAPSKLCSMRPLFYLIALQVVFYLMAGHGIACQEGHKTFAGISSEVSDVLIPPGMKDSWKTILASSPNCFDGPVKIEEMVFRERTGSLGTWLIQGRSMTPSPLSNRSMKLTGGFTMAPRFIPGGSCHCIFRTCAIGMTVLSRPLWRDGASQSIQTHNPEGHHVSGDENVNGLLKTVVYSVPVMQKADWEIQLDIENQIWWNPVLSDQDIVPTVMDGQVILTGSVEHVHQRLLAEQEALVAGASLVINRLRMKPDSSGSARTGTGGHID